MLADWLAEADDPLGALINEQLRRAGLALSDEGVRRYEDDPTDDEPTRFHVRLPRGDARLRCELRVRWRRGLPDRVTIPDYAQPPGSEYANEELTPDEVVHLLRGTRQHLPTLRQAAVTVHERTPIEVVRGWSGPSLELDVSPMARPDWRVLGRLERLRELVVTPYDFAVDLVQCPELRGLRALDLTRGDLSARVGRDLLRALADGPLDQLTSLRLGWLDWTDPPDGADLARLARLPLRHLSLQVRAIDLHREHSPPPEAAGWPRAIEQLLAASPALRSVELNVAPVTAGMLTALRGAPELRRLTVCPSQDDLDRRAARALAALPLTTLVLDQQLDDLRPLASLGRASSLRALRVEVGTLQPKTLDPLGQLTQLEALRVRSWRYGWLLEKPREPHDARCLRSLGKLNGLRQLVLDLSDTSIPLRHLPVLPALHTLTLLSCHFEAQADLDHLLRFPALRYLDGGWSYYPSLDWQPVAGAPWAARSGARYRRYVERR